jgi:hypothetical protein
VPGLGKQKALKRLTMHASRQNHANHDPPHKIS